MNTLTNYNFKPIKITQAEFEQFRDLIYNSVGIYLNDNKKDLVISRLNRRLRALSLKSFSEYFQYLKEQGEDSSEMIQMINRITTNKTDFFREKYHFDFLRDEFLPRLASTGHPFKILIWSAGCSSGEEPYTIATVMQEFAEKNPGWAYKILATDLDTEILKRASAGIYSEEVTSPIPKHLLHKYFTQAKEGNEMKYQVKPILRDNISFRKLNFKMPDYRIKVDFDFIFFRNVMIYFDTALKEHIIGNFHNALKDNGLVFIGHSESLLFVKNKFKYLRNTIYQKV